MKKLALVFEGLEPYHMEKDVGMVPVSLAATGQFDCEILRMRERDDEIPAAFRGVTVRNFKKLPLFSKLRKLPLVLYLAGNAGKIDVLMLFHLTPRTWWYTAIYRFFNPNGFVYLKLDMDTPSLQEFNLLKNGRERRRLKGSLEKAGLISVETGEVYRAIRRGLLGVEIEKKLVYIPNGVDEEEIVRKKVRVRGFAEKENVLITVGRIGTDQKNSGMLLRALGNLDLNGWKCFFVGPVEPGFRGEIEKFYTEHPDKKESVQFTGRLEKREILFDYFSRAKVFVLTSVRESFGIVLAEAVYFGDYIVSTDVGAARDVTDDGKLGRIIQVNDSAALEKELKKLLSGETGLSGYYDWIVSRARNQFLWYRIGKTLAEEIMIKLRDQEVAK